MASVTYLKAALVDLRVTETIGLCTGFTYDENGDKVPVGEPVGMNYAPQVLDASGWDDGFQDGDERVTSATTQDIVFPAADGDWGTFTYVVLRLESDGSVVDVLPMDEAHTVLDGAQFTIPAGFYSRSLS